jgi:hypothetical protein
MLPTTITRTVETTVAAIPPALHRVSVSELPHADRIGSPALIGIDANGHVALEMMYGADDWLAQYVITSDGTVRDQRDEDYGQNADFEPLDLSSFQRVSPASPEAARRLVFVGGRWRGLRETDRLLDVLHPLSIAEKMALSSMTVNSLTGPILGIVESRILTAVPITDRWTLLCRQVRIAFSVPVKRDADGLPYDYDSRALHLAHWIDLMAPLPDLSDSGDDAMLRLDQLLAFSRNTFGAQPTDLLYDPLRRRLYLIDTPDHASPATLQIFEHP